MIIVEYESNNSGGAWWLNDNDWRALEKAGWKILWANYDLAFLNGYYQFDAEGYPIIKKVSEDERFLGAIAQRAWFKCNNIQEALQSFEKITGEDLGDEGCNCCGPPHRFKWKDKDGEHSASGEELLPLLFNKNQKSLREFYEEE